MTPEFLFFVNLVLLLRLRLLLSSKPHSRSAWMGKGAVETVALLLFAPHLFLLGAAATNIVLNVGAAVWDRRGGSRNVGHLLLGAGQLIALSIWFSPAGAVQFRPGVEHVWATVLDWTALGASVRTALAAGGLKIVAGLLLAANETNLFLRWTIERLKLKPSGSTATADADEYNRGRVIGLLERALIYVFVLTGQFGAIGFTLAAKGLTRFKELENRGFAEYVLIGTLLSSSLAIVIGLLVKLAL
jgi:hypothetical protein